MAKKGVHIPKSKGSFISAERYLDPNPRNFSRAAQAEKIERAEKAEAITIECLKAMEKTEGAWTPRQQALAAYYTRHLIYGEPISGMTIPQAIKDRVWTAVKEACEKTGHQLPPRKRSAGKKKR